MTLGVQEVVQSKVWNVPNQITLARLVLALGLFLALHLNSYRVSLTLFLAAAATDWIDGYVARRTGQVTRLGRILDPFADKIVVCGTFIFLAAVPNSPIQPWMAALVTGRELLVTALRSFLEKHRQDFSANMSGKLKMVFQCAAAVATMMFLRLAQLHLPTGWLALAASGLAWVAVLSTIYSGVIYVLAASRLASALAE